MSTTTSLARLRGFTVELLEILNTGPLRTSALCQKTQKQRQYVETYLYRMEEYGLAMKTGSFWNLTSQGQDFTTYLKREDEFLTDYKQTNKQRKQIENRKKTDRKHLADTLSQKVKFQAQFALWLQENPLSDVEKGVVDHLVSHYNRTRQKFIIVSNRYELAEQLQVNPEILGDALKKLYQDRVAYCVRYQSLYWKIGLYVAFLEGLQKSGV